MTRSPLSGSPADAPGAAPAGTPGTVPAGSPTGIPGSTPAPGRRSRLSPERVADIHETVLDLVIERGYAALSMDTVAAACRCSKATLYRRWGDKPTLVMTAAADRSGIFPVEVDTGSLTGDLEELMHLLAARADHNIRLLLILTTASLTDPALRAAMDTVMDPAVSLFTAIGTRARDRGEITDSAVFDRLTSLLIGVLFTPTVFGDTSVTMDESYLQDALHRVILPVLLAGE